MDLGGGTDVQRNKLSKSNQKFFSPGFLGQSTSLLQTSHHNQPDKIERQNMVGHTGYHAATYRDLT